MLKVHHLGRSQSERIVWLCEELEIPYDLVRYDREPTGAAPPAYKALHPVGTAPIIQDGDLVLMESGAIAEYIARRHGDGRLILGPEHPDFADYLFWFHYANASVLAAVMMDVIAARLGAPSATGRKSRADIAFDLVEAHLGKATWFAGSQFTLADIMMVFPLTTMRLSVERDISDSPNLLAYLQRVGERPAYRAAMAKGDPGMTPKLT
ncbi:glutathione S-transferase family protein [Caulobacter soli]|uniref:glutathione S-transferase family protein n=1 Tax=Caulobacter soli TaxID=2708539 RepID=UPI0013EB6F4B|nr:glutathione S-transferase family protein [Caulobacter soli]